MSVTEGWQPVPGAALITGPSAGAVLEAAFGAVGVRVASWRRRAVHHRRDDVSVVFDVRADPPPSRREVVAHVSRRPVPEGAARIGVDGDTVHVWPLDADPYLPGLPSASSPARVRELLDGLGVAPGAVTLRRRSYRPSRRAVVEVRVAAGAEPASVLFLKVIGGRDADAVVRRTRAVVTPHRALRAAGLPVPAVIGVAESQGIVALGAVGGQTLHQLIVSGSGALPAADEIVGLTVRLAEVPLETRADPPAFAAATRHVAPLTQALPDLGPAIREVATAADSAAGPQGTVHGDLHDGQLLLTDGRITGLLDVDGAGTGRLVHDAGRLIAYVGTGQELGGGAADRAARFAAELFDAYALLLTPDDLRRAVAGAWLSLATNPLRTRDRDWRDRVRARIATATGWLEARA